MTDGAPKVSKKQSKGERVDATLETARASLDQGDVFASERAALDAVLKAHDMPDYVRMGRAVAMLREARAEKRRLAVEAGFAGILDTEVPEQGPITPGCYLVRPPRVGVDGRSLREVADRDHSPILVAIREPTTRDGRCPVVTLGPVTIRTKVALPENEEAPDTDWFVDAMEALAEVGIDEMERETRAVQRVDGLLDRALAHPDGDAIHGALIEACDVAAKAADEADAKARAKG